MRMKKYISVFILFLTITFSKVQAQYAFDVVPLISYGGCTANAGNQLFSTFYIESTPPTSIFENLSGFHTGSWFGLNSPSNWFIRRPTGQNTFVIKRFIPFFGNLIFADSLVVSLTDAQFDCADTSGTCIGICYPDYGIIRLNRNSIRKLDMHYTSELLDSVRTNSPNEIYTCRTTEDVVIYPKPWGLQSPDMQEFNYILADSFNYQVAVNNNQFVSVNNTSSSFTYPYGNNPILRLFKFQNFTEQTLADSLGHLSAKNWLRFRPKFIPDSTSAAQGYTDYKFVYMHYYTGTLHIVDTLTYHYNLGVYVDTLLVRVYRGIDSLPTVLIYPCKAGNDSNGVIKIRMHEILKQVPACDSNNLVYKLTKDGILNNSWDDNCLTSFNVTKTGNDTVFTGLKAGDYWLEVKCGSNILETPLTRCPYATLINLKYKEFPPILPDEVAYVCPKQPTILHIDSSIYTNNVLWNYCCLSELDPTKKINLTSNTQVFLGGTFGGYVHVEAKTADGCYAKDTVYIADFNPPLLKLKQIDSVLNVSASKFKSIWKPIYSSVQWSSVEELNEFKNKLPFEKGTFGMNRPSQVFDYIDIRNQSKNNQNETEVNLKADGVFNKFNMFNWTHPGFFECAPKWTLNHTITNYNTGSFEVENKDILKRYSTALYSYGGKLEIATAANAGYEEIGFDNFEEYRVSEFNQINQLNNATGNLDIVSNIVGLRYPYVLEFTIDAAFGRYALVKNIVGNLCCDIPLNVSFQAKSIEKEGIKSQEISKDATVLVSTSPCTSNNDSKLVTFQSTNKAVPFPFSNGPLCDRFWSGTLLVNKEVLVYDQSNPKISLDSTTAHTGKNSIKIDTGYTSIPQYDLHLSADKNYVISAWIHTVDNANFPPEQLEVKNKSNNVGVSLKVGNLSTALYPKGEVIEGWQRLEGIVHVTDKDKVPYLEFMNTVPFNLDDLRIFPENGSIQTYVYDPSNYRLRAVLDQNNYATLYQYDDEGNLFSIKKETVAGIKTIQATENFIKIKP